MFLTMYFYKKEGALFPFALGLLLGLNIYGCIYSPIVKLD